MYYLFAFYGKEVRGTEGGVYHHLYNKKIKKILKKILEKNFQKIKFWKNFRI